MNWDDFYNKNLAPTEPSDFAKFVMSLKLDAQSAVDLGCGNGRDTRLLDSRYRTVGIDPAGRDDIFNLPILLRAGAKESTRVISAADLVYSRFFLHSVDEATEDAVLDATKRYFCAEARIIGDEPKIYADHERRFVDGQKLLSKAISKGFRVLHYREGRGMAKYRDEDPLVCRIILERV
jgi:hypothetical protein